MGGRGHCLRVLEHKLMDKPFPCIFGNTILGILRLGVFVVEGCELRLSLHFIVFIETKTNCIQIQIGRLF
jgi:hypothetical protein